MDQPVANVTEADVARIALRDFGAEQQQLVSSILQEFGRQDWHSASTRSRVRLAILKLASGDIDALRRQTTTAIKDPRDVLAPAEYPRWTREIGFDRVAESLRLQVIDDDWKQYCEWLEREPR